jgi:hypothetical protein
VPPPHRRGDRPGPLHPPPRRHPGHRSINLTPDDITVIDGIVLTTVARTQLDLAAVVSPRGVERSLDQAEVLQVFDLQAITDQLTRNPGHPGAGRLRAALSRYAVGSAVTDSELEEAFVALCRAHALPMPELHGAIDPGDGGVLLRPDAVWREQKLVVELDGEQFHRTHRAFHDDRARDQRLLAAGWRVTRITWTQLVRRPQEPAAQEPAAQGPAAQGPAAQGPAELLARMLAG